MYMQECLMHEMTGTYLFSHWFIMYIYYQSGQVIFKYGHTFITSISKTLC